MSDLFPVFEAPKIIVTEDNLVKQRVGMSFDFETGDFKLDNGGRIETASPYDVWVQWCLKTVYTQRWAYLGYSDQIGVEMEEAFNQESGEAAESYIEYTISEALLADPYSRTKRVYDFNFKWETDSVKVTFIVSGIWDSDYTITVNLRKGW